MSEHEVGNLTAQCKKCGKSLVNTRAGSFTSYLFQQNYCQCNKVLAGRQTKASEPSKGREPSEGRGQSDAAGKARSSGSSGGSELAPSLVCTRCGKSVAKKRAGSFTSFLFQELRCQCAQPALPKQERLARTNTQVRRQVMAEKRGFTANFKASAESGRKLPQADFSPGTVIGGVFMIDSVIGEGGMGIVYLAQHLSLNRPFALKVLSPSIVSEQSWLRFKAEAKTLAALNHPGLVRVYDLGIHESTVPYYSMDYLEGETLEDLLVRKGPQELEYTISIFLAVLDTLAYAHRNNVVHRDIKPANIFICRNQEIKILDFGISKLLVDKNSQHNQELTAIGEVFGSPYYMSPEQCRGEQIDFRSDIYSAGCTLFETLTGYVPFESANSLEIAMLHEEGEIPLLSDVCDIAFPPSLDLVIAKCLAKLPQDRYQSAKEMAIDLTRIKEGKNLEAYAGGARSSKVDSVDGTQVLSRKQLFLVVSVCLFLTAGLSIWIYGSVMVGPDARITDYLRRKKITSSLQGELTVQPRSDLTANSLEGEKNALVEEYLSKAVKPYSVVVKTDGRTLKGFDFPANFSLGTLKVAFKDQIKSCAARGRVSVPLNARLDLQAEQCVTDYPELLSRFRPGELHGLGCAYGPAKSYRLLTLISCQTSLESLSLSEMTLGAEDLRKLNGLNRLTRLTLRNCSCSPNSLSKLSLLARLSDVAAIRCSVSLCSQLLEALSHNSHLTELTLLDAHLNHSDIKALASIGSLKSLYLRSSTVDNSDLKTLTALRNLQVLDVSSTGVDEKCIDSLVKFPKLKDLTVSGVSPASIKRLRLASPGLLVRGFYVSGPDSTSLEIQED